MSDKPIQYCEITVKSYELLLALLGVDPTKLIETKEIEKRLLEMALAFCPDAVPEIYL